jgi:hypothetical protein
MGTELVGTELLNKSLIVICRFAKLVQENLQDKTIDFKDIIDMGKIAVDFFNIVKNVSALKEEFLDLSEEEKDHLSQIVEKELQLTNGIIKDSLDGIFDAILKLSQVLNKLKPFRDIDD